MIRPIEMQMLLPRTEAVSQVQHNENQRSTVENSFAAGQVAKDTKHNSETVIKKDPTDFPEYKYDAKEKGNNEYQDNRRRKKKREQEKKEKMLNKNQEENQPRVNFDIKL